MTNGDKMVTLALIRQIDLQRVSEWMLRQVLDDLREAEREIEAAVFRRRPNAGRTAGSVRERQQQLLNDIEDTILEVMKEIKRRSVEWFDQVQEIQTEDERRNWLLIFGLSASGVKRGGAASTIGAGETLGERLDAAGDDWLRRSRIVVRDSVAGAATAEEIAGRFGGKVPGAELIPVASPTERAVKQAFDIEAGAIQSQVAAAASPSGTSHGYMHVSILDSKTTDVCRARAFKRWDAEKRPIGHALPFRHPPLTPPVHPCRSRIVPILLDEQTTNWTFKQWVDDALTTAQQEQVFGAKKLALWRKGLLTDAEMIRQTGRPMSIEGLRRATEAKNAQNEFPFL